MRRHFRRRKCVRRSKLETFPHFQIATSKLAALLNDARRILRSPSHKQGGFVLAMKSIAAIGSPRPWGLFSGWIAFAALATLLATGCNNGESASPTASIGGDGYREPSTKRTAETPPVNQEPTVQVRTSAGEFTLKLYSKQAPLTVQNFLSYVNSGHYNGTIFHQAYDGFILLGGGYDTEFIQRATEPPVRNEAHNEASKGAVKNRRGTIAMARQNGAIDSATSQFFINLAENTSLDFTGYDPSQYGYCVFGEVTDGMDVVERIAKGEVHNTAQFENVPTQPVVIESVRYVK
jgi:cyclophilin family peptidyl-prolyl cis-trans isomerase